MSANFEIITKQGLMLFATVEQTGAKTITVTVNNEPKEFANFQEAVSAMMKIGYTRIAKKRKE